MTVLVRMFALAVGITFGANVNALTLGEYIDITNGKDDHAKEQLIYYFGGVTDALLYANEALIPFAKGHKSVCFPSPIPSRKALMEVFRDHVEKIIKAGEIEKASGAGLDQIIYASWMGSVQNSVSFL